jgi:hypothetical protein
MISSVHTAKHQIPLNIYTECRRANGHILMCDILFNSWRTMI